jgi:hypothetical protein
MRTRIFDAKGVGADCARQLGWAGHEAVLADETCA